MSLPPTDRVLVVDDDVGLAGVYTLVLEDSGYTVVAESRNGQEALDFLVSSEDRHVVFLDMHLPDMDGMEFMRKLCQRPDVAARCAVVMFVVSRSRAAEASRFDASPCPFFQTFCQPFIVDEVLRLAALAAESWDPSTSPQRRTTKNRSNGMESDTSQPTRARCYIRPPRSHYKGGLPGKHRGGKGPGGKAAK